MIMELLECGVILIINENDFIFVEELIFGDNDMFFVLVSGLIYVDQFMIFIDINGLYDVNLNENFEVK